MFGYLDSQQEHSPARRVRPEQTRPIHTPVELDGFTRELAASSDLCAEAEGDELANAAEPSSERDAIVYWNDGVSTRATVLASGIGVLVLQGPTPRGHAQLVGTIVRVQPPGSSSRRASRIAAYGQGNTFLVALGLRAIRRAPRSRVDVPAVARVGTRQPTHCRIVDLSRSGARVLGVAAPIGSILELSYVAPGNGRVQVVRAVVVRADVDSEGPRVGVAFCLGDPGAGRKSRGAASRGRTTTL
jgi:hypothetical protein